MNLGAAPSVSAPTETTGARKVFNFDKKKGRRRKKGGAIIGRKRKKVDPRAKHNRDLKAAAESSSSSSSSSSRRSSSSSSSEDEDEMRVEVSCGEEEDGEVDPGAVAAAMAHRRLLAVRGNAPRVAAKTCPNCGKVFHSQHYRDKHVQDQGTACRARAAKRKQARAECWRQDAGDGARTKRSRTKLASAKRTRSAVTNPTCEPVEISVANPTCEPVKVPHVRGAEGVYLVTPRGVTFLHAHHCPNTDETQAAVQKYTAPDPTNPNQRTVPALYFWRRVVAAARAAGIAGLADKPKRRDEIRARKRWNRTVAWDLTNKRARYKHLHRVFREGRHVKWILCSNEATVPCIAVPSFPSAGYPSVHARGLVHSGGAFTVVDGPPLGSRAKTRRYHIVCAKWLDNVVGADHGQMAARARSKPCPTCGMTFSYVQPKKRCATN